MKQKSLILGATIALSMNHLHGATLALAVQDDTYLSQNAATTNYGTSTTLQIGPTGDGQQKTAVFRFDATPLQNQYQSIESVTLRFNIADTGTTGNFNLRLLTAGNALWQENTATWSTQNGTNVWAGGAPNQTANAAGSWAFTLNSATNTVGSWVEITLDPSSFGASVNTWEEILTQWETSNAGFQIYGGSGTNNWSFKSSEDATANLRPELVVNYTAVPEPSAVLLGGIGVLALLRRRRA